jgi:hypothetical protein
MEQVGENRRAAGRESPSGSSLAPRGLTGLLNPLSIWHKIISVVFHGLFQLYFIPSQGCSTTARAPADESLRTIDRCLTSPAPRSTAA